MRKKLFSAILLLGVLFDSSARSGFNVPVLFNCVYPSNADSVYHYKITQSAGNTWGYDILKDDKIFIHQPFIPGMPGQAGFRTKQDAVKVARLVVEKIKKGEIPPTVTVEELKALRVLD